MEIVNLITGKTKLLGVIGNPLSHSISPQLHNTVSRGLGIDAVYVPFLVEKGDLGAAVRGLKAINIVGFNITIPYKNEVVRYIDEVSREAALVGAVNTVKNVNGKLYGYNTDIPGFIRSFKEESGMDDLRGKRVALLGAGGAARAIAVGLAFEGISRLYIINRTRGKAADIAELINGNISPVAEYHGTSDTKIEEVLTKSDIIINATSVGMYPDVNKTPLDFPFSFLPRQVLYDVIYNPGKTRFLEEGEKQGIKVVNGLGMLIYQGIMAYEIWMGIKVPDEITRRLFEFFPGLPCREGFYGRNFH
ncbi:MAG: shikimate dehydrogenase [Clostridiaceae bacterium]|nr:shikimate dehydrogenase [Clostridiaceae bacterium]